MPKKYNIGKPSDMRRLGRDMAKNLETGAKRHPIRVPVELEAGNAPGNGPGPITRLPDRANQGVADSESEAVVAALLDALLDQHESGGGRVLDIREHVDRLTEPFHAWAVKRPEAFGEILSNRGLVHKSRSVVWLSETGVSEAVAQRDRRGSTTTRRQAVREAVLRYVYDAEASGVHFPVTGKVRYTHLGCFEGQQVTEREVNDATLHLRETDLINGSASWGGGVVRAGTTADGKRVVESFGGSIAAWERAKEGGTHVVTNNVTNSGYIGNVAQAGHVSGGMGQYTESPTESVDLSVLVSKLRTALPELELDADERQDFGQELERLEAESARQEPNGRRVRGALGDVRDFLTRDKGEQAKALLPIVAAALAVFGS